MAYLTGADSYRLMGEDGYHLTDGLNDGAFNWRPTVISQYANSPVINAVIGTFSLAVDQSDNIDAFYDQVWNVDTATGWGLDVWGRIVGVSRVLKVTPEGMWGFREGSYAPLNQGPFYAGPVSSDNYPLADGAFRSLILLKASANIGSPTAPATNEALRALFKDRGRCYACDLGAMQVMYTFEFALRPYEVAILRQSGAVPRPAGVGLYFLQTNPTERFGFAEGGWQPFGQGGFFGDPDRAS